MPRDRRLLRLLADHRVFTTEQVAALMFPSLTRAQQRLRLLHQRTVLGRFRAAQAVGSQSWRWCLGPIGAAIIAAERDQSIPRPSVVNARVDRLAGSQHLLHLLGVNQFFCALANYARANPGCKLARWWHERAATKVCGDLVHPDGHGEWCQDGRSLRFWLEYDTGTETLPRLFEKINTDYRYLTSALAFPVLFWLPSRARETNLHTALARIEVHPVTVATATSDSAKGAHPADPIWWVHGHQERVRLIDIPPTPY